MIIGTLKAGLTALEAAGMVWKIVIAGGLALGLLGIYGAWHHQIYQSGVNDTIAGIAREDSRWINRALQARNKWEECHAQKREWDQSTGRCL